MGKSVSTAKSRKRRRPLEVHKPQGTIHPRVQAVGPERFGIVCVDCAKQRSKWMLCDFYGKVLYPPTTVTHLQGELALMVGAVKESALQAGLQDLIVCVERTGTYHQLVRRAFAAAGYEVRIVHPFTTRQFRQTMHPDDKTDDHDLAALQLAAVNGFGLLEAPRDATSCQLQLLVRHRRDLVEKCTALRCQIREALHAMMPRYAECFNDLWDSAIALPVARRTGSPQAVLELGAKGLSEWLHLAQLRFQERSVERIVAWARMACQNDPQAALHQRILITLDDDRLTKQAHIQALERDLAALLVRTPYLLLMSVPGIHVVSAADFAGEMGPIAHYAGPKTITGRAGLFPARYQSDQVDVTGALVRCANRPLRRAILQVADNLVKCNHYFGALAATWTKLGKDPRHTRVRVASRFCRIAYSMVAGQQVFKHPACAERSYILDKLVTFHREHQTPLPQVLADLQAACDQLPRDAHAAEAAPLKVYLKHSRAASAKGPQALGDLLPVVLARLGLTELESTSIGDQGSS